MPNPVSLGQPVALQNVTSPGYSAMDLRRALRALGAAGQEGVLAFSLTSDFKVSQDTGTNMDVSVAAGEAVVQGDATADQATYYCRSAAAQADLTVPAAHATLARVDQVVLEVKDDAHDASGVNEMRLRVVAGTASSGATLDNRTGAAALPSSAVRLADVLVPAAATAVTNANIRDRRPWARGANLRIVRTSNAAGADDYTTTSTSFVLVDTSNLQPRIECSGVPMRVTLSGRHLNAVGSNFNSYAPYVDGAAAESGATDVFTELITTSDVILPLEWTFVPSAGSRLIGFVWRASAGTALFRARPSAPLQFTVQEVVRQNSANG